MNVRWLRYCLVILGFSLFLEAQFRPKRARVSEGFAETLVIKKVQPAYPADARKKHIEGNVNMQIGITKGGLVENVRVLSGDPILAQAATDAVKQWKYKPYILGGREPLAIQTQVTVTFTLKKR